MEILAVQSYYSYISNNLGYLSIIYNIYALKAYFISIFICILKISHIKADKNTG
jgi:hypothetical protein